MNTLCSTLPRLLVTLIFFLPGFALAQESRFDTDNEGWRANGDPVSTIPDWMPAGGNPGGWVRTIDASSGGTWQWVAPSKFLGNKCLSYGNFLRFDLTASAASPNPSRADVTLVSGATQIVFNNPNDPGITWTHYDIPLREDAGWRIGNVNGPVPSAAQFRAILSGLTSLVIRGEFLSSADDEGGLDNVVLENDFDFDLDANDSTTPTGSLNFQSDTLCGGPGPVADLDFLLLSQTVIDSIVVEITGPPDGTAEQLQLPALPPALSATGVNSGRIVLRNKGNATPVDFQTAILLIRYANAAPNATRATRFVATRVFTFCGETATGQALIPYFPAGFAGKDSLTTLCAYAPVQDLRSLLGTPVTMDGRWSPPLPSGSHLFRPAFDPPGKYTYIVESPAHCPSDSADVLLGIAYPPQPLQPDTVLCRDSTLTLQVQPAALFDTWQWNTGQNQPAITVSGPGTYRVAVHSLLGDCTFRDSVAVGEFVANAGSDAGVTLCSYDDPSDLRAFLGISVSPDGQWAPPLAGGGHVFEPATDAGGQFEYQVAGQYGCPGDSALLDLTVVYPPVLTPDSTICRDSTLTLRVMPPGVFKSWDWSNGRQQPAITVSEAGVYGVTVTSAKGACVFEDSVAVDVYTCAECPLYVPNVFSPNDDGENDGFRVFSNCAFLHFRLQIFDRWGNLLFSSENPDQAWSGISRGQNVPPGVFVWVLETDAELFGQAVHRERYGSVTLVR